MKPILVTGGAGYIGSHACKALAQDRYLPVADNMGYPPELVADAKLARSKPGWSLGFTAIKTIIATAGSGEKGK